MGFITLGVFSLKAAGAQGALLQMVNHRLVVAPLLLIIGYLAARAGASEPLQGLGGIAFRAAVVAVLFVIIALASLVMAGSPNFAGKFCILLGVFRSKVVICVVAFTGVALAPVYTLRMFIGAMHNRVNDAVESRELALRDELVLVPLVVAIIALSLYPQLELKRGERSTRASIRP